MTRRASAGIVFIALSAALIGLSSVASASSSPRSASYPVRFGTATFEHGAPVGIHSAFRGLTLPSQRSRDLSRLHAAPLLHLHVVTLADLRRAHARELGATANRVVVSGSFAVLGMPARSTVRAVVLACPGSSPFGAACGTRAAPSYEALARLDRGSHSHGEFQFGALPRSSSGWRIAVVLSAGSLEDAHLPFGTPALVAQGGSTRSVTRKLDARFIATDLDGSFRVLHLPAGTTYEYSAYACRSGVTADQLGFFINAGACPMVSGSGGSSRPVALRFYVAPGNWTIWVDYEPLRSGYLVFASEAAGARFQLSSASTHVGSPRTTSAFAVAADLRQPSIIGTATVRLPSETVVGAIILTDAAGHELAGFRVGTLSFGSNFTVKFEGFLEPGKVVPYSLVIPAQEADFNQLLPVDSDQILIQQLGPDVTVRPLVPISVAYDLDTYATSVHGTVSITGVTDDLDTSGFDNAQQYSFVQVCPGTTAQLDCTDGFQVSSGALLGGAFELFGLSGPTSMAFVYVTLAGQVVEGPATTTTPGATPTSVTIGAPYSPPSVSGAVALSNPLGLYSMLLWAQACPSSETFGLECANGVSAELPFYNVVNALYSNSQFPLGYAIDLPAGSWRIAIAGEATSASAAAQLGPSQSVTVGSGTTVLPLKATT
jgi:hypothetical protein